MKAKSEILERAFRAIDELLEEPPSAPPKREKQSPTAENERVHLVEDERVHLVEMACTCGKYSFPHIHSREERRKAVEDWNRDSQHKIAEWIQ